MRKDGFVRIAALASSIFFAVSIFLIPATLTYQGPDLNVAYAAADCSLAGKAGGPPDGFTTATTIEFTDPSAGTIQRDACKNAAGDTAIFDPGFSSWTRVTTAGGDLAPVRGPTSCSGFWNNIASPGTCIARALFAGIASFLIYIGVECLTASGLLFEAVLKYTVVSFQTPMYESVQDAVNNAWTVFRDISNILIIGFFTFIAISTILGIAEYGAKKLLSRVLIVAVLINFSLLFTKLVIDGSNFTAYQFYNASISDVDGAKKTAAGEEIPGSNTSSSAQITGNGIAGSFIQYLGVTGFANSYNAVRDVQEANDDASTGLVIGVLSFIFLMATALVFLYGSFILLTRAILFIFLLVTSSLAFATYLIPTLARNYGWEKWWAALFKNAILAPILMMMLWVTLTVSAGISGKFGPSGTLGDLAKNPTSAGNITALLNFVIILGLLYASFRLASKFSGGIGGFNFAGMALGMLGGGALNATAATGSLFGRNVIGRNAANNSLDLEKKIRAQNLHLATLQSGTAAHSKGLQELEALRKQKVNADKTAKRDFNFMATSVGNAIAKKAGVAATKPGGGYVDSRKKIAEEAAKSASDLVISKKDAEEKARDMVGQELAKQREPHDKVLSDTKQVIQLEQQNSGHAANYERANKELASLLEKSAQEKSQLDNQLQNKIISQVEHKQAIDQQTTRINAARTAVASIGNELKAIEAKHMEGAVVKHAEEQIAKLTQDSVAATKQLANTYRTNSIENAGTVASSENHADDYTAAFIRKNTSKVANESGLLRELRNMQKKSAESDTSTPPAAHS